MRTTTTTSSSAGKTRSKAVGIEDCIAELTRLAERKSVVKAWPSGAVYISKELGGKRVEKYVARLGGRLIAVIVEDRGEAGAEAEEAEEA